MSLTVDLNPQQRVLEKLRRNTRLLPGLSVLGLTIFSALAAPWLTPFLLGEGELLDRLCAPGTVALSLSFGTLIGLPSKYWRGWLDVLVMRIVGIFMAFRGILLALTLAAIMGPSFYAVVFAIAASGWTSAARLIRAHLLTVREREFVQASRPLGASNRRLIFKQVSAALLSPLVVHATFSLPSVIIVEAGLSFLGFGARDAVLTWGGLLGQASQVDLSQAPHLAAIPGLAIFALAMPLNLMGDACETLLTHTVEDVS